MTTNQKVAGSSPAERAPKSPANHYLSRVLSADDRRKPYRLRPYLTREDRPEEDKLVPPPKSRNRSSPRLHLQMRPPMHLLVGLSIGTADLWIVTSAERAWQTEKSQDYAVQEPIREQPVQRQHTLGGRAGGASSRAYRGWLPSRAPRLAYSSPPLREQSQPARARAP